MIKWLHIHKWQYKKEEVVEPLTCQNFQKIMRQYMSFKQDSKTGNVVYSFIDETRLCKNCYKKQFKGNNGWIDSELSKDEKRDKVFKKLGI